MIDVAYVQCDNPACQKREAIQRVKAQRSSWHTLPAGWFVTHGYDGHAVVCSLECAETAFDGKLWDYI